VYKSLSRESRIIYYMVNQLDNFSQGYRKVMVEQEVLK